MQFLYYRITYVYHTKLWQEKLWKIWQNNINAIHHYFTSQIPDTPK